ncbi:synaptopodin-2-like [Megalops cyprinoides]|uniref:synaptopodin-2-like n=1 Tax=Megalops cyprinoides TaxID=118141 RepID=UPI0018640767|nr:synaptopodin-2-like [Megalops cyprinoides]
MRSASMGTGDYLCVTVRGGAPWGFTLRQGNELHQPLLVSQVDSGGRAALAGLCEGDEVVSLNGEPCADLTLRDSMDIMDASGENLQLLVKRCVVRDSPDLDSEQAYFEETEAVKEGLESTTLEIYPGGSHSPRELYISESQDEAYYGETESDTDQPRGRSRAQEGVEPVERSSLEAPCRGRTFRGVAPGAVVELQLSFSDHSLDEPRASLRPDAVAPHRESSCDLDSGGSKTELLYSLRSSREPLGQRGELLSSSSSLGQVEVTLQHPGKGRQREEDEEEEEEGASGRVLPREEGGLVEAPPACVSFGISAEGPEPAEEWDSETERDLGRPNKHRARHARLRRSESQSEKQVKEAKSKCKRIALLLTAAPNPNNKGVLMFKKHRQRAKKYTLVSYGTGENDPEDEYEDEDQDEQDEALEITLLATSESELDEDFFANAQGRGGVVTYDWDTGLLEVEKKLDAQGGMERLPETKGKGALMFAKRRQRIDEITAEHEEMRRKGIPVEGLQEAENAMVAKSQQIEGGSSMQPAVSPTTQAYMDVNMQQLQQQQQQEQQQLQQQHYLQQQQMQQYPHSVNGMVLQQANETPRSLVPNRTAKPFSGVQNRVPAPFSPTRSVTSPVSPGYPENKYRVVQPPAPVNARPQVWSPTGELIASRDERISVPAIKTGILHDTRKRGTAKAPSSMLPNPQLPQKGELASEEDYLSLGAEACNFLQTPTVKYKTPPPVAPKPTINPAAPPWATENTAQVPLLLAQNEVPAAALGPAVVTAQTRSPQPRVAMGSWTPPEPQIQPRSPAPGWAPAQLQAQPQPAVNAWTPQPQLAPVSTTAPTQPHAAPRQPAKPWNKPRGATHSMVSRPANSYPHAARAQSAYTADEISSEKPAMKGRGAELFARRQARMEKFVVDAETVQANKVKPSSPTPSLPSSWKYSPNVRAPPPLSYNPILSPFYPPAAAKQPPPSAPSEKAKSKAKSAPPPRHLNVLDVMKHQPYQLNSSLFTYEPNVEAKSPSPKPASTPDLAPAHIPTLTPSPTPAQAPGPPSVKSTGPVSVPYPFAKEQSPPPAVHDGPICQAPANPQHPPPSTYAVPSFPPPSKAESFTGAGVLSAPRPKFSAKKSALTTKAWKPVVMGQ